MCPNWTKNFNAWSCSVEQLVTFFLSYSPRNYSHFLKDIEKDNWLKVQRQSRNGLGKGSIEGSQIHKSRKVQVESSGASSSQEVKSTSCTILCSVSTAKMQERCQASDAVEIGRVKAWNNELFSFLTNCLNLHEKVEFFIIRYLIINFKTFFLNLNCLTGLCEPFEPVWIRLCHSIW